MDAADWTIEPFSKRHDRSVFSCGRPSLDDFLRTRVSPYEKRRLGKTFMAVFQGDARVVGYYTLAAGAIAFDNLPIEFSRKLPKHPVPVVLLARLAVDGTAQGQGLGEALLLDALQRAFDLSTHLGIHAIEVEAIDDAAAAFYRKYGFEPLLSHTLHFFLPIAAIENLLGQ